MSEKPTPAAVYKSIIDEIVNKTRRYGCSSHVREDGIYSKAPAHQPFNEFIARLSQEQREVLANMLRKNTKERFTTFWLHFPGILIATTSDSHTMANRCQSTSAVWACMAISSAAAMAGTGLKTAIDSTMLTEEIFLPTPLKMDSNG